jgi:hypothetical protein
MDFKMQSNQQAQSQSQAGVPSRHVSNGGSNGSGSRRMLTALVGLVVLVVVVVGLLFAWQAKNGSTGATGVEKDRYQAVFMTNGQVYFGKLAKLDAGYTELTDVYYLQVQQSVQPGAKEEAAAANSEQPQVSLTKLGNELHGPTDKMHIAKDQILFWENLKDDSTVVKAIKDYQSKQQ